jgi:hypothetical protein
MSSEEKKMGGADVTTKEKKNSCIASVGNPERKLPFGKPGLT